MSAAWFLARVLVCVGYGFQLAALALMTVAATGVQATVINGVYGAGIEYVSGGAIISDGSGVTFQGRNWDVPSGRTVRATDTNGTLRLGGKDININAARTMAPSAINRAAAIALKGLAPVAVGIELWDLFNEVRVRPGTCAEGGLSSAVSDLLCFDAGADPTTETADAWGGSSSSPCSWSVSGASGYSSALNAVVGQLGSCQNNTNLSTQWSAGTCTTGVGYADCYIKRAQCYSGGATCTLPSPTNYDLLRFTLTSQTVTQCPASIDASNPANNIPAGLPVGEDGKCLTGRYNAPVTPQQAADKLEAYAPPTGEQLRDMAQDAIASGQGIEASERQVSGPASAQGTPTTTTAPNPGGGTTTTTKTPTTHYTYNNNTVNYTIVTVTTVNDGTTTTTTTEGTVPEESDQCKTAPDSLGCSKMGKPGDENPQWQTRDVVFAAEDLGFTGSCPAPESWEVFNMSLTWGYEPICDVAPFIRFALLAFAGIGAISVVIRETNS